NLGEYYPLSIRLIAFASESRPATCSPGGERFEREKWF
ncbi:MAG: hypothetical protein ACI9LN_004120, partial [Saprospiraceae bacterium]